MIEAVAEIQQQHIDDFLNEFSNFNSKQEKKRLKTLIHRLQELNRHSNGELYNNSNIYTRNFFKLKKEIQQLQARVAKYEENKHLVDVFARTHQQYVLKKYGKIV